LLKSKPQNRPESAQAAYNLSVMLGERKPEESLKFSRLAVELNPGDPKYQYSLAFYLLKSENKDEAMEILNKIIQEQPDYQDSWFLLGSVYEQEGEIEQARKLYQKAMENESLSPENKEALQQKLEAMKQGY